MKFAMVNGEMGYFEKGAWFSTQGFKYVPPSNQELHEHIIRIENLLRESLTYHVDLNVIGHSQVIVAGILNGQDYVKVFNIPKEALPEIVKILREFNHLAKPGRMDLPREMRLLGF